MSQAPGSPRRDERLVVVSPVYNEGKHLERTARAIAMQRRPPDVWIVVDDGSTDDTMEIARTLARELPFMHAIRAPLAADEPSLSDRLAVAKDARAFNHGLREVDRRRFTHIGKLDGDVELPPEWFEHLLARFRADPSLGIAGGSLAEPGPRGWKRLLIPDYHVHGAVKLYARRCFEEVGGIEERLGWDTIDETYARMHGYTTRSFRDLVGRHHRHWGSADGRLRRRARHGECAYVLRYGAPWTLARALKVAKAPPVGLSGVAFAYGYIRAAVRSAPRVEDEAFRRFVRRELRARWLPRSRTSD
jgi:poly-beta-1,6-N-acetyl-D-glucosamine synthase